MAISGDRPLSVDNLRAVLDRIATGGGSSLRR